MYLYIYKNFPGLKGRCGVFGYFTPVSGIAETHAMTFLCAGNLLLVSCPPTSTNKLVGGADCSAQCSIYIVAFCAYSVCKFTFPVSVIVRSVRDYIGSKRYHLPGSQDYCLAACLLADEAHCTEVAKSNLSTLSTTHSTTITYSG